MIRPAAITPTIPKANMTTQNELSQRLVDITRQLVTDEDLSTTLSRVASLSAAMIDACDSCGVSLVEEGEKVSTRAASHARADRVDEIQYSTGEGPCLQAIIDGEPVRVRDFTHEERWPEFIQRAIREGVHASYSVPLEVEDKIVGSINFYSYDRPFSPEDEELSEVFAAQAAIALKNAQTLDEVRSLVTQLNEAVDSRDVIGQAKGILMARMAVSSEEAFDVLRTESQNRNVKLRDLAARLVEAAGNERAPDPDDKHGEEASSLGDEV